MKGGGLCGFNDPGILGFLGALKKINGPTREETLAISG